MKVNGWYKSIATTYIELLSCSKQSTEEDNVDSVKERTYPNNGALKKGERLGRLSKHLEPVS